MSEHIPTHSFLRQYLYEIKGWERLLSFHKEELVYYKNRLAEVVNGTADAEIILLAENFQESFLAQERIVHFLTDELTRQKRVLESRPDGTGELSAEMAAGQKKLRREIREGEDSFAAVKEQFEQFLHNRFGLVS